MDKPDHSTFGDGIKKALTREYPDIRDVMAVDGHEKDTMVGALACLMNDLSIVSLSIRLEKESILVIRHDYEPLYVMVKAVPCDASSRFGRAVRQMLAAYELSVSTQATMLPAMAVNDAFSRWERDIGLLFGEKFALRTIASVIETRNMSSFTMKDLERSRMRLIGVTGGCLSLKMPPASSFERK